MPSKGKAKGNKWENDVCKLFGDVFNLSFKRVPTSGAMTGGQNAALLSLLSESQKLLLRGDIIVPDELRNIVLECKSRKEFPYHQLLESSKELNDWITQLDHDLTDSSLLGLLIFKANRRTPFVCYEKRWCTTNVSSPTSKCYLALKCSPTHINYNFNNKDYIIEPFTTEWIESNKEYMLTLCKGK
jgi:hypothetical protein